MSDITVRPLSINNEDFQAFAQIHATAFGRTEPEILETLKDNPRYNASHVVVAEAENNVIGKATMFPAQIWLSGVPLNIGAIAGVAVLPEARKQGAGGKLIEAQIAQAAQAEYALAVLFPFSHRYYHKFGFGVISDVYAYCLAPSNLMDFEEKSLVRPFDEGDLPMMRVMYKGQMTWHNGWFSRSNDWWGEIIKRWPNVVVFENDGMIDGYLAYEISSGEQTTLHIKEFFAAEGAAARGLIGFLAHQTEVDVVEYLAPADSIFHHCLTQLRSEDAKNRGFIFEDLCHVTAGPMARIINLKTALTKRFYARHMQGERIIKLTDPLIPDNEKPVSFRLVDGRAESHDAPEGKAPQIETDIRTFTQILCGYLPAIDAQRLGRLQADEDTCSWLDKALVDSPIYIQPSDWF